MLSDKCQSVIDEALTAYNNSSELSAEVSSHLKNCIECRRSFEAIKALKASVLSVIPASNSTILKNKISSKIDDQMQARSIANNGLIKSALIGIPIVFCIAGGITYSVLVSGTPNLSTNKNQQTNVNVELNKGIATESVILNSPLVTEEEKTLTNTNNSAKLTKEYLEKNLQNNENLTQTIPSPIKE